MNVFTICWILALVVVGGLAMFILGMAYGIMNEQDREEERRQRAFDRHPAGRDL